MYVCVSIDSEMDHQTNLVNVSLPSKPQNTGNLHWVLNIKINAQVNNKQM